MVAWVYEHIIEETVCWFCRTALPDAGDWSQSRYHLVEVPPDEYSGRAFRVDIDIPLEDPTALPCWLTFTISKPAAGDEERVYVKHLSAVRGAVGTEEEGTYSWDDSTIAWAVVPENGRGNKRCEWA